MRNNIKQLFSLWDSEGTEYSLSDKTLRKLLELEDNNAVIMPYISL